MDNVTLDYGEPNEMAMDEEQQGGRDVEGGEGELDAEMQQWEDNYAGDMDDFEEKRVEKREELRQGMEGARFYPLPAEEGIDAGATRGVSSQRAIAEDELLGPEEDAVAPEAPTTIGGGQDVRFSVLHLSGSPITQCSTSRLFAFITHYGAQPLGLEWVNDSSCNVVFSNASAARIAIEYLCPAVSTSHGPLIPLPNDQELDEAVDRKRRLEDPLDEEASTANEAWNDIFMQSLLFPRKSYRIPAKLYNAPERDAAAELRKNKEEEEIEGRPNELSEDVPEIYREMEEEDRQKRLRKPEQINLQKLRGTMWIRWALESLDVKPSRAAKQSKWYREHGNDAGREVVTKLLNVGGPGDRLELLPGSRSHHGGGPGAERGRGGRQAAMDGLDAEMDAWREGKEGEGNGERVEERRAFLPAWNHQPPPSRRTRHDRRGRTTMESLDEELDFERRDRSASPARVSSDYSRGREQRGRPSNGSSSVKVKGRGRMKAPSAWDDGANEGMQGDEYRSHSGPARRWYHQTTGDRDPRSGLEGRMSQSLQDRIGGDGHSLQDRLG